MRRRLLLCGAALAAAFGALLAPGSLAVVRLVGWAAGGAGQGRVEAQRIAQGAPPTGSATGRAVTVSWPETEASGGTPASGYVVRRYADGGGAATVLPGCNGVVAALTCTENDVPTGVWRYSVQPVLAGWIGTESIRSAALTVGSAQLVFTSSTTVAAAALPVSLSGTVTTFLPSESLSFHLDSPTGPTLSGSPTAVGLGGGATIAVTIPAGTDGAPHSVFAVGGLGSRASAAITITDPPVLSRLEMFDVDVNGRIDRVTATFTRPLAPYSAGLAPWTLTGAPSGASLSGVTVAGSAATLVLAEGGGSPTTAVGSFTVALAGNSSGIRTTYGQVATFPATSPIDRAAPALVGVPSMNDLTANGLVDQVTMAWSEPLAPSTAGTTAWTLANPPSGATLASVSLPSSTTVALALAEGPGPPDTSVGAFTISLAAVGDGIRDVDGNLTLLTGVVPADNATPVRVAMSAFDDNVNGRFDRVAVTFSEPLAAYAAGNTGWALSAPPTGTTLNNVAVSGQIATLSLNEGTSVSTAIGSWKVALSANAAGVRDAAGKLASFVAVAPADLARPVATGPPQLLDAVANGKVDRVTVVMSEPLAAYSAGTAPWALSGVPSGGTLASVAVVNGTTTATVTLTLTEGPGAADTTVGAMTVTLASNATGIRDPLGNRSSFGPTAPVDKAKPARLTSSAFDDDVNGKFDRVAVTFSEALATPYTAGTTGWTLTTVPVGMTLRSVTVSGSVATLVLNEGTTQITSVGSWKVALAANAGGIRDAAANLSSSNGVAPTDRAAPVLKTLTMLDASGGDGVVDKLTAVFSESLSTYSAGVTPWALANVPSGRTLSSVSLSSATITLTLAGGTGIADTTVGSFTVALSTSATGVRDAAANLGSFAAVAPIDGAGPAATAVTDTNGAIDGQIEPGDSLTVTFSEPLGPTVVLAPLTTVTLDDPTTSTIDDLIIPGILSGARPTGSGTYVVTDGTSATFDASPVVLSADRRTVTVTVGPTCTGTGCAGLGALTTPASFSFIADPALRDAVGVVPTTVARTFSVRLF